MKKTFELSGLDCAACAAELEEEIAAIEGITSASVSFVNQKLTVEYTDERVLEKVVYAANHFEEVRVVEPNGKTDDKTETEKKHSRAARVALWTAEAILLVLCAVFFIVKPKGKTFEILEYITYGALYLLIAYPVLKATVKNLAKGRIFDENFLMTVASVGALLLGEWLEGIAVMLLYQIGEALQSKAVETSRNSVSELMSLKSEWATVLVEKEHGCSCGHCEHEHDHGHDHDHEHDHESERGETEQVVRRPEEVKIGDILLVKAGEKVPVDGVLLDETAALDTKSLTGESDIRKLKRGDELLSGCINAGNVFTMKVVRPYEDSAVSKILDMVENASSRKAAPEKFITKFARYYTPIVCILALALAVFAPLLSGLIVDGRLYFKDFARWAQSALTFLVISCPCALIISVPLTYFSGIGSCAKQGILVKGATYLDAVAKAKIVAFDKTGTLTEGNFVVCAVTPAADMTETELLSLVAAVEKGSAHPIAKAFENYAVEGKAERIAEIAGRGLTAGVDGERVLVGNAELMQENGITVTAVKSAYTLVYAAKNGKYLGYVEVGDKLRAEAKTAIEELKTLGLERTVMLTGDSVARAERIAEEVGIGEVNAQLLPDGKLKRAEELKKEGGLIYVGDGINDAPVMATSDCAASMGKLGSAAAVEASDLVLISDDLKALPRCVRIARKTGKIVVQNIVFSILMKAAFMALGVIGVLPLWLAVFADVGVMLLAVLNSFRVRMKIK